jgi:hypothetical protein
MECNNHVASAKVTQLDATHAPARHRFEIKIGRFIANLQHAAASFAFLTNHNGKIGVMDQNT